MSDPHDPRPTDSVAPLPSAPGEPARPDWRIRLAARLRSRGATPNGISLFAIGLAALAGLSFFFALRDPPLAGVVLLLFAAVCLQGRMLCNRLDGLLARRGGMVGKAGEVYSDAPDRLADTLIFLGVGYGLAPWLSWASDLGWAASLLSVGTAYVRVLGLACGLREHAQGPMSRRMRMIAMSLAALLSAIGLALGWTQWVEALLAAALAAVALGTAVTIGLRLRSIVRELEAR
ncbi:CDP-alcohol phosphatidyltransferase family protein [Lysobacter capsici]|uniref:CDP-alcohol phosphatidyltransferase family protein n=1 Tax=Lysobacter capsici TaxID=435897 RepID=UPI0007214A5E|nr:CDP-alcohol phosphatidyltransferase family protein [Lysobacter capsici]ALN84161.1 CDP-alcohol phosphatidyltransferase family protein [Lysobacter capsici]